MKRRLLGAAVAVAIAAGSLKAHAPARRTSYTVHRQSGDQ